MLLIAKEELSADGGNSAISTIIEGKAALTTDNSGGKVIHYTRNGQGFVVVQPLQKEVVVCCYSPKL